MRGEQLMLNRDILDKFEEGGVFTFNEWEEFNECYGYGWLMEIGNNLNIYGWNNKYSEEMLEILLVREITEENTIISIAIEKKISIYVGCNKEDHEYITKRIDRIVDRIASNYVSAPFKKEETNENNTMY